MDHVIFVRGGKTPDKLVWRNFHFDPSRDRQVGTVKLSYFDYPNKKLKIWNRWVPKHGKAPEGTPDSEEEIEPQIEVRLSDGSIDRGTKLPSCLAVYEYVKKQPASSVVSFQIFSHGDYDGPILWAHSFENVDKDDLTLPRDDHDTEFRRRDFHGGNPLSGAGGLFFADAFKSPALVKIWGCNEDSKYRVLLRSFLHTPKNRQEKRRTILESYLEILDRTFALDFGRLLHQPVWAAPVGWGTTPWGNEPYKGNFPPDLDKELWWRVPSTFTRSYRELYTDVLRAPLDITRYVGFEAGWYDRAYLDATRDQPLDPSFLDPAALQQQLHSRLPRLDLPGDSPPTDSSGTS